MTAKTGVKVHVVNRFPHHPFLRPLLLAAGAAILAACGKTEPSQPPASPPAAKPAAPAPAATAPIAVNQQRLSSVPLKDIGLVHDGVPSSLEEHTWETEHVNDSAGHQLKEIGKLLAAKDGMLADRLAAGKLTPLLAKEFRCTPLRPSLTDTNIPPLTVRRFAGKPAEPHVMDAGAFSKEILTLFKEVPAPQQVTALFKIFRVSASPPETLVRVEIVARGAERSIQSVSHWRCRWQARGEGQYPLLASVTVEALEETATPAARTFTDCTGTLLGQDPSFRDHLAHGLDHWVSRMEQQYVFGPSGWEGFAMGDANGDGREDLHICQPGGLPNRLLIQNSDGTLTDRARDSGVDWWDQTQAAIFSDFDDDGDQDLAVAMIWGVLFMANDGTGKFTPAGSKLSPDGMPYSMAAADYDGDGDLDLYVSCYAKRATAVAQRFLARPLPYHDATNGSRNMLLRNDRRFRFRDVTQSVGLSENNNRFSFAVAWEDYDGDGDLDLYVANDFGRNNLYRCDRTLDRVTFKDVAAAAGVEDISAGMSASWGDANNDGRPDIYVSNMWSSAGNRVTYQRRFREGSGDLASFQRHAKGNTLFQNAGDGTFLDISEPANVTMGRWAWGSRFADLNHDGWEDLIVANGYITQPDPGDL